MIVRHIKMTGYNDPYVFFWYFIDSNGEKGMIVPEQLEYKLSNGTTTKDWHALRYLVRLNKWYKITENGVYYRETNYDVRSYLIEESSDPNQFDWKSVLFLTREKKKGNKYGYWV